MSQYHEPTSTTSIRRAFSSLYPHLSLSHSLPTYHHYHQIFQFQFHRLYISVRYLPKASSLLPSTPFTTPAAVVVKIINLHSTTSNSSKRTGVLCGIYNNENTYFRNIILNIRIIIIIVKLGCLWNRIFFSTDPIQCRSRYKFGSNSTESNNTVFILHILWFCI